MDAVKSVADGGRLASQGYPYLSVPLAPRQRELGLTTRPDAGKKLVPKQTLCSMYAAPLAVNFSLFILHTPSRGCGLNDFLRLLPCSKFVVE